MNQQIASDTSNPFVLQAPELITPVSEQVAKTAAPLTDELKTASFVN